MLGKAATAPAGGYTLPCLNITDEPRFSYRGFMLDVARHFFSVEEVKNCSTSCRSTNSTVSTGI